MTYLPLLLVLAIIVMPACGVKDPPLPPIKIDILAKTPPAETSPDDPEKEEEETAKKAPKSP